MLIHLVVDTEQPALAEGEFVCANHQKISFV